MAINTVIRLPRQMGKQGFASMDPALRKEIASKGGKAAHARGVAHEFDSAEASAAAKKGHERGTAHEFTAEEARLAGRKGGTARAANARAKRGRATVYPDSNYTPPETKLLLAIFNTPFIFGLCEFTSPPYIEQLRFKMPEGATEHIGEALTIRIKTREGLERLRSIVAKLPK